MNKQKLNRILIISLLIIWSFVGYKFFSNFFFSGQKSILENPYKGIVSVNLAQKDTFKLMEINRDPFLGTYRTPTKEKNVTPNYNNKLVVKKVSAWPKIEYFGFVQNINSKNPLVLLKVNNQLKRIRKGDKTENIYIKEVYLDSILIYKGKEYQTFLRQ